MSYIYNDTRIELGCEVATGDPVDTYLPEDHFVTGDRESAIHPLWVDVHSCGCVRVGTLSDPITYDSIDAAQDAHDFTLINR